MAPTATSRAATQGASGADTPLPKPTRGVSPAEQQGLRPRQTRQMRPVTGERLLTAAAVARKLGISRMQLYRLLPRLRAGGVQVVRIPSSVEGGPPIRRYRASSLDRLIDQACETGHVLAAKRKNNATVKKCTT